MSISWLFYIWLLHGSPICMEGFESIPYNYKGESPKQSLATAFSSDQVTFEEGFLLVHPIGFVSINSVNKFRGFHMWLIHPYSAWLLWTFLSTLTCSDSLLLSKKSNYKKIIKKIIEKKKSFESMSLCESMNLLREHNSSVDAFHFK